MQHSALDCLYSILAEKQGVRDAKDFLGKKSSFIGRILANEILQRLITSLTSHRLRKSILFFLNYRGIYQIPPEEKTFALNFLTYCLKENPKIPFNLFPEKDFSQIEKFVKNKFLLSVSEETENLLWAPQRGVKPRNWGNKAKIKIKYLPLRNTYQVLGYLTKSPRIEFNLLANKYGLKYIKKTKKIRRTVAVDGGSFDGLSSWMINKELSPEMVLSIEPFPLNFQLLLKNIRLNRLSRVIPVNKALGEKPGHSRISGNQLISRLSNQGQVIKVDSIDKLCQKVKVGLIKLDIEGSEFKALKGAKKTILRDKPTLIVSLYHRGEDFFEIPSFLKKLVPAYRFRFVCLDPDTLTMERALIAEI